jgi:hypothetical protein
MSEVGVRFPSAAFSLGLAGIDKPEAQAKGLKQPSLALQACGAFTNKSKADELLAVGS